MFKKFIPFAHAENIYDIDVNFFKKLGLKYLLIDLDNTLDSYKASTPKQNVLLEKNLIVSLSKTEEEMSFFFFF